MRERFEALAAVLLSFLVLFVAMRSPALAALLAIAILVGFALYKLEHLPRNSRVRQAVQLSILLLMAMLDWAALHDIIKGKQYSYTLEYLILFLSVGVLMVVLFLNATRGLKTPTKTHQLRMSKGDQRKPSATIPNSDTKPKA